MRYLVIGEGVELGLIPPQELAKYLEQVVIPSMDALAKLEEEKKITGGVFSGARNGAFIVEAESNEEIDRLLKSLPFWGMAKWTVTPLISAKDRAAQDREGVERLKSISQ